PLGHFSAGPRRIAERPVDGRYGAAGGESSTFVKTPRPAAVAAPPPQIVSTTRARATSAGSAERTTPCSSTGILLRPTARPSKPRAPPAMPRVSRELRRITSTPTRTKISSLPASTHFPSELYVSSANPAAV